MLSDIAIKEIEKSIAKYPVKRSAVMDALHIAQKHNGGHLIREDMAEIAEILEITPVSVHEVAAFYTMYNVEKPVGKYHIQVCHNISCSLVKAEGIIDTIEKALGIKAGQTTEDKLFTLSRVECLGSCGTAPMMQVNDDYHEDLTPEKTKELLEKFRSEA